jgi:large subunit ribosomal protein L30
VVAVVVAETAGDSRHIVPEEEKTMAKLRVKYIKSAIGYPKDQKATIRALGFHKLQQTVEHEDQPAIRGMVRKVMHLVQVEEIVSETL